MREVTSHSTCLERAPLCEGEGNILNNTSTKLEGAGKKLKEKLEAAEQTLQDALSGGKSDLEVAKAELQVAKAELQVAKAELQVTKSEGKSDLEVAKAELQVANAELQVAEQKLQVAKAELQVAEQKLQVAKAELQVAETRLKEANTESERRTGQFLFDQALENVKAATENVKAATAGVTRTEGYATQCQEVLFMEKASSTSGQNPGVNVELVEELRSLTLEQRSLRLEQSSQHALLESMQTMLIQEKQSVTMSGCSGQEWTRFMRDVPLRKSPDTIPVCGDDRSTGTVDDFPFEWSYVENEGNQNEDMVRFLQHNLNLPSISGNNSTGTAHTVKLENFSRFRQALNASVNNWYIKGTCDIILLRMATNEDLAAESVKDSYLVIELKKQAGCDLSNDRRSQLSRGQLDSADNLRPLQDHAREALLELVAVNSMVSYRIPVLLYDGNKGYLYELDPHDDYVYHMCFLSNNKQVFAMMKKYIGFASEGKRIERSVDRGDPGASSSSQTGGGSLDPDVRSPPSDDGEGEDPSCDPATGMSTLTDSGSRQAVDQVSVDDEIEIAQRKSYALSRISSLMQAWRYDDPELVMKFKSLQATFRT